ncbi:MAG: hypothetical protein R3336_10205, partial [Phycisphaeraceae bacterium]|nr:hypothetical protein [Phycisphaeraceae bacterium]
VAPSHPDLEVVGVFNPAAAVVDGETMIVARVAEAVADSGEGDQLSPCWMEGKLQIDRVDTAAGCGDDPRKIEPSGGGTRLRFVSHLRAFYSEDGRTIDREGQRWMPEGPLETFGIEDPRLTVTDDGCRMTYVNVSRHGVATSLMTCDGGQAWERQGVIFCPENKDVVWLPERINGRWVAIHRPSTSESFGPPAIWVAESEDGLAWGRHRPLARGEQPWEGERIGAGPPPLAVEDGWLLMYHGSERPSGDQPVGTYRAGLMLLDRDDPSRILARTREPVLEPTETFEREGFVPDVIFPTGWVRDGDALRIYYGAADEHVGVLELQWTDVLSALH